MKLFLTFSLLLLLALPASAGDRVEIAQSARSVALGGTLTGLADDAMSPYWNPSGIATLQRQELVFSYADRYGIGLTNSAFGYVFPLFERHAVALNWAREGFGDTELDDSFQIFNLSYAAQLHRAVSLGIGGKWVNQSIDLDGASLRSASGFGFDLGLLFTPKIKPWDRFRFGVTLQDVTGTSVQDDNSQVREEILPQTLRGGIAFKARRDLSLAVDVGDNVSFGAEYQPHDALILRGGVNRPLSPVTGADKTLGFGLGLGLRWTNTRVDYAFEHHPVLPATHHAALSFSYSASLVSIKDALVRPSPVFKSLYRTYEQSDFVDVVLRNTSADPLEVTVSIDVPTMTETPHEETLTLAPQSTQRYGFNLSFPQDLLGPQSAYYDNLVQPSVKITYKQGRSQKTATKRLNNIYVLGKGKLSWQNPHRIAAFMTTESQTVDRFARGTVAGYTDLLAQRFGGNNVGKAALIFDALSAYGLRYQQDQTTPYVDIVGDDSVFDTVKYPTEFLSAKIGDCDDCTAIFCSMLENLNIPTAVLDVHDPEFGHIYMMFDSGISIDRAGDFFLNEKEYVLWQDRVWIPVETTLFGQSFSDAWRNGAEEYYLRKERGTISEFLVSEAQQTFMPGVVPDVDIALPSQTAIDEFFSRDLAYFDNRLDRIALGSGVSLEDAGGLYDAGATYLRLGQLERALEYFDRAVEMDPSNADAWNGRGVVFTHQRDYGQALAAYLNALKNNPNDAGYRLNVALTYHLQGKTEEAEQAYAQAVDQNREFAGILDRVLKNAPPSAGTQQSGAADPLRRIASNQAYGDGSSYLRLNRLDRAVETFDRALELNPDNIDALNAKGVVLTRQRKYPEAVALYNRAITLDSTDGGFQINLAITYHLMGQAAEARAAYKQAIEIEPSYEGTLEFLE